MRSSAAKALSVGVVATLSAAGMAWHECVLLAAAAAVGHRLFLWRMDDGAPWDAWRAGVRCLFAGLLGLLAAVALFAVIAAGLAGYWEMGHQHARARSRWWPPLPPYWCLSRWTGRPVGPKRASGPSSPEASR